MVQGARCAHCGQAHAPSAARCPVTGARLDGTGYTQVNEDEILVGSVVAERYHVKAVLGQGSTGTVFAVEHLVTGRPAAMKVLRPRYAAMDTLLRVFHGEARAAWSVVHPALCEVFDAGQLPDGAPFFLMERLAGETLATRIARERLSLGASVDVMMQVLAALDTMHRRDVVLRDLRPQNVFLCHRRGCRPVVKLLDVGLARLVPLDRVQEDWDALRSVLGGSDGAGSLAIPYYLSPERTRSEQGIGPASDLFVAGAIFYEALTGQPPFVSTSFNGLLLQIVQAQPAPMADFRSDVPPELDALVARVLAASPENRPATAADLQDELRGVFERGRRTAGSRPSMTVAAETTPPEPHPPGSAALASVVAVSAGAIPTPQVPIVPIPSLRHASPAAPAPPPPPSAVPSTNRSETHTPVPSAPSYSSIPVSASAPPEAFSAAAVPIPAAPSVPLDAYEEETRTDRNVTDLLAPHGVSSDRPTQTPDEASADSPHRTAPPPPFGGGIDVDVDVDVDDPSEQTQKTRISRSKDEDGDPAEQTKQTRIARAKDDDDEETATLELTPEVRAKIDAMLKTPPTTTDTDAQPPHTRRMK